MRFLNWKATLRKAREDGLMEGYAKGRAEGRAEIDRAWESWLQREAAAAERNEPFNEPPPSQTQG